MSPQVSVLMAVHNGQAYLKEAIDSILQQALQDFEFIIIDDASRDSSAEIIRSYRDKRIKLIQNSGNLGLTVSLNVGLQACQGEFVARMDADDVSLPARLKTQVKFMQRHSRLGVCGTFMKQLGGRKHWTPATRVDRVCAELIFNSPLNHPTVMWRQAFFKKFNLQYDPAFKAAQDYDLWWRASRHFPLTNIAKVLHLYRLHGEQVGESKKALQEESADRVRRMQLEALGLEVTAAVLDLHRRVSVQKYDGFADWVTLQNWLDALQRANQLKKIYPEPAFSKLLQERWRAVQRQHKI